MQVQPVEMAREPHPEHVPYWKYVLQQWHASLFRPKIRLNVQFPWGLKDFSKFYAVAAVYYVIGSMLPILLIFGGVIFAVRMAPDLVWPYVAMPDGHPKPIVMLIATLASFLGGFGTEVWYMNRQLRKQNLSLAQVLAMNLNSLHGSWGEAFKRSLVAFGVSLMIQSSLEFFPAVPRPHQATAAMASNLDASGMVGFVLLASIMAPFFEEVIFRGFVFNAFRNIFREGRIFRLIGSSQRVADYAAIVLSALIFAAAHMDASAFVHLFFIGVVLAELYRRSGSLVCPIMLHAMNNMMATVLIAAGK